MTKNVRGVTMIYQVAYYRSEHQNFGFEYFDNIGDALEAAKDYEKNNEDSEYTITPITIPSNKEQMINLLNLFAGHPDNG